MLFSLPFTMSREYSTLEFDSDHQAGLELDPNQTTQIPKATYREYDENNGASHESHMNGVIVQEGHKEVAGVHGAPDRKKSICGLSPLWFWTALIGTIVIVGAALGGGLGAGLTPRSSDNESSAVR